jgi:hypothetical protein
MATCVYYPEYGLAKVSAFNMSVNTLLTWPDNKRAAEKAFLGARYSRSLGALTNLCKEFRKSGTDASERLDKIFHDYGHQSVGDMAEIMVYLENIPLYTALKIFNIVPTYAGQESSTRYIDFTNTSFFTTGDKEYEEISQGWFDLYNKYKEPFEQYLTSTYTSKKKKDKSGIACALYDSLRYFLPLGATTNLALSTSARNIARLISELRSSRYIADNQIAALLLILLTKQTDNSLLEELGDKKSEDIISNLLYEQGYIAEAAELIRHSEPNYTQININKQVVRLLNDNTDKLEINTDTSTKLSNDRYLATPFLELLGYKNKNIFSKEINEIINNNSTKYFDELGNVYQQGFINIQGYMDIGSLRDLNRQRSAERYIPYLQENWNIEHYVINNPVIYLPPIIQDKELINQMRLDLSTQLTKIKDYYLEVKYEELVYYLLPLCFGVSYNFGFSISDLYYIGKLRTKLGGHIAYRRITKQWLDLVRHIVDIPLQEEKDEPTLLGKLSELEIYSRG